MTVTATNSARIQYTANAGDTVFPFPFEITDQDNLNVYSRIAGSTPNDVADILVRGVDYTVSPTSYTIPASGTVTLVVASLQGDIVTIEANAPNETVTSFTPAGALNAQSLNTGFDNDVLIQQTIATILNKLVPKYPQSAVLTQTKDIPLVVLDALESWRMNAGATAIEAFEALDVSTVSGVKFIVQQANAQVPSAQALGNLGTGILRNTTVTGVLSIDAPMTALSNLAYGADKLAYSTAASSFALVDFTAYSRTLLPLTTAADWRTQLGVSSTGTDLPLAGGTMTGNINMDGNDITNLGTFSFTDGTFDITFTAPVLTQTNNYILPPDYPSVTGYILSSTDAGVMTWVPNSAGSVISVTGTANEVDVDNTDPQNPVLSLSATINAPGTFNIQSTTSINAILDEDDMASNSNTAVPTQQSVKAYADSIASGFSPIAGVRLATTAALTVTYDNGTSGVGATLTNAGAQAALSLDGVATAVNDRILVKDQASALQNGIYTVTDIGSGASNWVMTRATDFDTSAKMDVGDLASVQSGTANGNSSWYLNAAVATVGVSAVNFSVFFLPSNFVSSTLATGKIYRGNGSNIATATTAQYPDVATATGAMMYADGTNWIASTSLWPNTVGTAGKILRSNGTSNAYTTATYPDTAGTSGNVLTSDGTNWVSSPAASPADAGINISLMLMGG